MAQKNKTINYFSKDLVIKFKLINPYIRLANVKEIANALDKINIDLYKIIAIDDKHDDIKLAKGDLDTYDDGKGDGDPYYNWGQYD